MAVGSKEREKKRSEHCWGEVDFPSKALILVIL